MATTPGMVVIRKGGEVAMKVVVGSNGNLAQRFADAIRSEREAPSVGHAYELSAQMGFGSRQDRIVITRARIVYKGDGVIRTAEYLRTFDDPYHLPLWVPGDTQISVEIVDIPLT